ncbi:collagen alpha-1(I) chain-like [Hippopotamus amphibius kiboko]|uniref:collagen alpha-1(I) chain-like n=1 Tax=Hippopotamus amphibius kiboko TaxID=575201 RepID=UPI002592DE20|nr:collagen alpha-1(I) chain-like [Hippopotamus amphibius kiboko]
MNTQDPCRNGCIQTPGLAGHHGTIAGVRPRPRPARPPLPDVLPASGPATYLRVFSLSSPARPPGKDPPAGSAREQADSGETPPATRWGPGCAEQEREDAPAPKHTAFLTGCVFTLTSSWSRRRQDPSERSNPLGRHLLPEMNVAGGEGVTWVKPRPPKSRLDVLTPVPAPLTCGEWGLADGLWGGPDPRQLGPGRRADAEDGDSFLGSLDPLSSTGRSGGGAARAGSPRGRAPGSPDQSRSFFCTEAPPTTLRAARPLPPAEWTPSGVALRSEGGVSTRPHAHPRLCAARTASHTWEAERTGQQHDRVCLPVSAARFKGKNRGEEEASGGPGGRHHPPQPTSGPLSWGVRHGSLPRSFSEWGGCARRAPGSLSPGSAPGLSASRASQDLESTLTVVPLLLPGLLPDVGPGAPPAEPREDRRVPGSISAPEADETHPLPCSRRPAQEPIWEAPSGDARPQDASKTAASCRAAGVTHRAGTAGQGLLPETVRGERPRCSRRAQVSARGAWQGQRRRKLFQRLLASHTGDPRQRGRSWAEGRVRGSGGRGRSAEHGGESGGPQSLHSPPRGVTPAQPPTEGTGRAEASTPGCQLPGEPPAGVGGGGLARSPPPPSRTAPSGPAGAALRRPCLRLLEPSRTRPPAHPFACFGPVPALCGHPADVRGGRRPREALSRARTAASLLPRPCRFYARGPEEDDATAPWQRAGPALRTASAPGEHPVTHGPSVAPGVMVPDRPPSFQRQAPGADLSGGPRTGVGGHPRIHHKPTARPSLPDPQRYQRDDAPPPCLFRNSICPLPCGPREQRAVMQRERPRLCWEREAPPTEASGRSSSDLPGTQGLLEDGPRPPPAWPPSAPGLECHRESPGAGPDRQG